MKTSPQEQSASSRPWLRPVLTIVASMTGCYLISMACVNGSAGEPQAYYVPEAQLVCHMSHKLGSDYLVLMNADVTTAAASLYSSLPPMTWPWWCPAFADIKPASGEETVVIAGGLPFRAVHIITASNETYSVNAYRVYVNDSGVVFPLGIIVVGFVGNVIVLYAAMLAPRAALLGYRFRTHKCLFCGYSVVGVVAPECPECGKPRRCSWRIILRAVLI